MADKVNCSVTVTDGWHRSKCSRKAKVVEDGKPYCGQHAPSALQARRAARDAKWRSESAFLSAKYKAQDAVKAAEAAVIERAIADDTAESKVLVEARRKLAELMNRGTT